MSLVEKRDLKNFISGAKKIIGKNSESILNQIVIHSNSSRISLGCTDLKYWLFADIPFVPDGFSISNTDLEETLFSFVGLCETVNACKASQIDIQVTDSQLYFDSFQLTKSESSYTRYPDLPCKEEDIEASGRMENSETFYRSFLFKSEDLYRAFLNGVHLILENRKVNLESTDGKIAMLTTEPVGDCSSKSKKEYIIRDVSRFERLEMLQFDISQEWVKWHGEKFSLFVTNIDGQYPSLQRMVKYTDNMHRWEYDWADMEKALSELENLLKIAGRPKHPGISVDKSRIGPVDGPNLDVSFKSDFPYTVIFKFDYLKLVTEKEHDMFYTIPKQPYQTNNKYYKTTELIMPMI